MRRIHTRAIILALHLLAAGCQAPMPEARQAPCAARPRQEAIALGMKGPLLATRFRDLDHFKQVVQVEYLGDTTLPDSAPGRAVRLCYCAGRRTISSTLSSGTGQQHLEQARRGGAIDQAIFTLSSPAYMAHRKDLGRMELLSRHKQSIFGEGDPAFFDLADTTRRHIPRAHLRSRNPRDTTEKGYINTFNHITAQAFITTLFSEDFADMAADLHERKNMPSLVSGRFSPQQLDDPENNPVDNYVDMLNNEWGQELGKILRAKHRITRATTWTPTLLADYLNDIQAFYAWAFQLPMRPFRPEDEVVWRFTKKINFMMHEWAG